MATPPIDVFDSFLLDTRGYAVVRGAVSSAEIAAANRELDALDVWGRAAPSIAANPANRWRITEDDTIRFVCPIDTDHIQAGPVSAWPAALSGLLSSQLVCAAIADVFPDGAYLDHASMSLARPGSGGIEIHGGGFARDARQYYSSDSQGWSAGLSIFALTLVSTTAGLGGTALVPGSHKSAFPPLAPLPDPASFADHDWISGVTMAAGDLLIFPEALMHGAYPWRHDWERRCLIMKVYPKHLANLGSRQRDPEHPFWV